jgi:hypothetical protein
MLSLSEGPMMTAKSFLRVVCFSVFSVGLGAAAAQTSSPCTTMLMRAVGAASYGETPKDNSAYTATVKTTHEQKLADGNAIHLFVTTHQARDSAGRTWEENFVGCEIQPDGKREPLYRISVYDPTAKLNLSWTVGGRAPKVVQAVHQPVRPPVAPPSPELVRQQKAANRQEQARTGSRSENLGTRSVDGVLCDGSRTVRIIPAGEEGNDLPIEELDELWIARDLGLAMLRIDDDPRTGRNTVEVVDLKMAEPDASLFAPPAGYTLQEQSTKVLTSVGTGTQ